MEEKRSKIKDLLKGILSNGGYVIGLVFICTLIIVAVINLGTTIDIIGRFLAIIAPFIFGFFFATVSSRMVGLVGSSNDPSYCCNIGKAFEKDKKR